MNEYFQLVFNRNNVEGGLELVRGVMTDLYNNKLPLDDFMLSKKIAKSEYTTLPPHVASWRRMVARVGQAQAPAIGERFNYVVTKGQKGEGMDVRIIDSMLVQEKGFENFQIDRDYYHQTFLFNPLYPIMKHIHGEKVATDVLDPKNYTFVETVVAKRGNLLGFFGKESMTKVVKKTKLK